MIGLVRRLIDRVLPAGALLLSVITFISYLLGLVRDVVFARSFGAGAELDAYNAAFQIPELALGVLIASGLSAPFVPIFLNLRSHDEDEARRFAGTVLSLVVLIVLVLTPILFVLAPQTVDLVAAGFDAEQRELYTSLFRLMLVTPFLFAVSDVLGELLVAERQFLGYALAPVLYNAGIVVGTVLLAGTLGIYAAALGAILGAVAHLGIRLWAIRRSGVRLRPAFRIRTPAIREFVGLSLPRAASHPIDPLTFALLGSLATTVTVGGLSSLSFARNFESVPVTVLAVSIALAVFPVLSTRAAEGDRRGFVRIVARNAVSIVLLTGAAAVALAILSGFVISLFFRGGAFTDADVERTTLMLVVMCLAIPFESLTYLLSRAIFATRHTLLQVLASLTSFAIVVVAAQLLIPLIGIAGIPLGYAIGMAAKVGLLTLALVPRVRAIGRPPAEVGEVSRSGSSGRR